jgi:hypothetical protein
MKRTAGVVVGLLVAGGASAQPDASLAQLEHQLPAGWSMLATDTELVLRHDRPCYVRSVYHENGPATERAVPVAPGGGPMITLELRYRLEPKWTPQQLAAARAANDKVGSELRSLRAKYKVDTIHTSKGRPLPMNDDERTRLDAYTKAEEPVRARIVALPRCTIGTFSVFDSEDTYRQMKLELDPPEAAREAQQVITLLDKVCTKP